MRNNDRRSIDRLLNTINGHISSHNSGLLTLTEASKLINYQGDKILKAIRSGKLYAIKTNGKWSIRNSDLFDWFDTEKDS